MKEPVEWIPIEKIRVINPRYRDQKKFATIIQSIERQGLKKPIKVSLRSKGEGDESGYDLVYGQGRIEAFRALGHTEIPAIVVNISKEDRLLLSLIENLARRYPAHGDIVREIIRLKEAGYSNVQVGKKLDIADSTVGGYLALINAGEERLLDAALKGRIPIWVAIEISKTEGVDQQRAFLKAYENGDMKHTSIRVVKQVIDQRHFHGKSKKTLRRASGDQQPTNPGEMVAIYQKQTQKMRSLVQKSKACETKILIVVTAFRRLLADGEFTTLLRSQKLATFPKYLADKLEIVSA